MTLYDFASLERLVIDRRLDHQNDGMVEALAVKLGVTVNTIHRHRKKGMRADTADRFACRAGLHPSLVWDSWFPDSIDDICTSCRGLISFQSSSDSPMCLRCRRALGKWEKKRNRALLRTFWERLDRYRETLDFSALDQPMEHTPRVESLVTERPGRALTPRAVTDSNHLTRGTSSMDSTPPVVGVAS